MEQHGNTRHGKARRVTTKSRIYQAYVNMMRRCNQPHNDAYADYGGRGIKVSDRFSTFAEFYDWFKEAFAVDDLPSGLSLDRYPDNNGNYEPGNIRLATPTEQNNNTRYNKHLTFNEQTHTLAEWSRITGISYPTIKSRVRYGWSTKDILTKPISPGKGWRKKTK